MTTVVAVGLPTVELLTLKWEAELTPIPVGVVLGVTG